MSYFLNTISARHQHDTQRWSGGEFGSVQKECFLLPAIKNTEQTPEFKFESGFTKHNPVFFFLTCIISANVRLSTFFRCRTAECQNSTRYSNAIFDWLLYSFLIGSWIYYYLIGLRVSLRLGTGLILTFLNVKVMQLDGRHCCNVNSWETQQMRASQANCVTLESAGFICIY